MRSIYLCVSIVLVFLSAVAGCEANSMEKEQEEYAESCDEELLQDLKDIPKLHLDMPSELQIWETNASLLRDSIAAHEGQAIIGLKAPESKRFRENHGYREALTAQQFKTAMHMLCGRENIEITDVYNTFGAVAVRMDPDEVFELFDHPMVDYIDFPMRYELALPRKQ